MLESSVSNGLTKKKEIKENLWIIVELVFLCMCFSNISFFSRPFSYSYVIVIATVINLGSTTECLWLLGKVKLDKDKRTKVCSICFFYHHSPLA